MWFSASLLSEGESPDRAPSEILWEESIVLIEADSEAEARIVAAKVAKDSETEYCTAMGEKISWKFRSIQSVYEMDGSSFKTGTELFSRFLRSSEVESLLADFEEPGGGIPDGKRDAKIG